MSEKSSFWSQVDKKTVLRFGVAAILLWVGFVAIFYGYYAWSDAQVVSENKNLLANIDLSQPAEESTFTPAFEESPTSTTPPSAEDLYAHRDLMDYYMQQGRADKSLPHEERIAPFFKGDSSFLIRSTKLSLDIGDYSGALQKAKAALENRPDDLSLQNMKLMAMYRLGNVDSTLTEGEKLLQNHPRDIELLTTLGTMEIESKKGQPDNDRYLRRALEIKPGYLPAMYQIGRKLHREGNYHDARFTFEKILEQDPTQSKARAQLAMTYFYLGLDDLAEKTYRTTLVLSPQDYNSWYNFGEFHLAKSYRAESIKEKRIFLRQALDEYQSALLYNPNHPQANFRLGVLLSGNKEYKEAINHLELALQNDPNNVRVLLQLSIAFEKLSMNEEALDFLQRAFRIDPHNKAVIFKIRELTAQAKDSASTSLSGWASLVKKLY